MDKEKTKLAVDKVFRDMAGAMAAGMAFVGTRTGLFRAMAGKGAMRLEDLLHATGLQRRYVEEWLRGMTAAGYLEYEPNGQTYELPEEMAYFVASDGSDHFVGGMWEMVPALMRVAPRVAQAFEKGGGVPFADFGPDCFHALDLINRGQYEERFAGYWLRSLPEVLARLQAGGRVLDFGCGSGRVCIALAKAFPKAEIFGVDVSAESLVRAQEAAAAAGVPRINFRSALPEGASFDLVTICDCIHDLTAPLETLRQVREVLRKDATLFIVEPKAADRLEDNRNPVAAMFYGFSLFHCMTQSLAHGGPGLGTCMGPGQTEKLLREAGFRGFRMLDIKSMTNLFYAATP